MILVSAEFLKNLHIFVLRAIFIFPTSRFDLLILFDCLFAERSS